MAAPAIAFKVVVSDPIVHLQIALSGLGIVDLPIYMARTPDVRERLMPGLPSWCPEPITLCALFSGPSRLTPKVQVLLDFLGEYIGTDQDPRLHGVPSKGMFTDPTLETILAP